MSRRMPAAFPVPGGPVEVSASAFGLKRCHYAPVEGTEHQLDPDPDSAEGRWADFDRVHPALSRGIGIISLIVLLIGLAILIPQVIASITEVPPIAEYIGTFPSPIQLSPWGNIVVMLITVAASMERALRLRYNVLLDGAAC